MCLFIQALTMIRNTHAAGELVKTLLLLFVRAMLVQRWHHPPVVFLRGHVTAQLQCRGVRVFCKLNRVIFQCKQTKVNVETQWTFLFNKKFKPHLNLCPRIVQNLTSYTFTYTFTQWLTPSESVALPIHLSVLFGGERKPENTEKSHKLKHKGSKCN